MAKLIEKWEDIDSSGNKAASTEFNVGDFVKFNGSGYIVPAADGDAICGVCLEPITSSDDDYASTRTIARQKVQNQYLFQIPVSVGTATASMEGSKFDIDAANPGSLDVSGSGTQITITKVISATLVEGYVSLVA